MNLVRKAVLKDKLRQAVLDQKIALYMLSTGDECADAMAGLAATLMVTLSACRIEKMACIEMSQIKGAYSACVQLMIAGRYDRLQTVAIARGLDCALVLAPKLNPTSIDRAWREIQTG